MSDWSSSSGSGGSTPPPTWGSGPPGSPPGPSQYSGGPSGGGYYQQQGSGGTNGLAVAAMVLGIISLVLLFIPFIGIPLGLIALVLGFLGRKKANETGSGGGMAITGIVTGILGIIAGILWIILVVSVVNTAGNVFNDATLCNQGDQLACDRLGIPNPQGG